MQFSWTSFFAAWSSAARNGHASVGHRGARQTKTRTNGRFNVDLRITQAPLSSKPLKLCYLNYKEVWERLGLYKDWFRIPCESQSICSYHDPVDDVGHPARGAQRKALVETCKSGYVACLMSDAEMHHEINAGVPE